MTELRCLFGTYLNRKNSWIRWYYQWVFFITHHTLRWIRHFWFNRDSLPSIILKEILHFSDIQTLLLSKSNHTRPLKDNFRTFFQTFQIWLKYHTIEPSMEEEVKEEMLWYHQCITSIGECLHWHKWTNTDINTKIWYSVFFPTSPADQVISPLCLVGNAN